MSDEIKKDEGFSNIHNGFAILSTILGLFSMISLWFIPYMTLATGIVGIFFGIASKKQEESQLTQIGIITSVIGLGLLALLAVALIATDSLSFAAFLGVL